MSSYVSFWVRNKKGQYTPLFDFSRSNSIYQACYELGICGKTVKRDENDYFGDCYALPFTKQNSNEVRGWLEEEIQRGKKSIENYEELVKQMWQANNSLEEKMEYINDYNQIIEELKEDLEQNQWGLNVVIAVEWIREANSYDNAAEVIYAGIDCRIEGEDNE